MDLIGKAVGGDADAFVELMEQNKQSMYRAARAILRNEEDVADAMQETIIACYQNIASLRQKKFFKTWLMRILINKCNDIIRQNKPTVCVEEIEECAVYSKDLDENLTLWQSFRGMPENYRLVMTLFYVEGFSIREIAVLLNLKENTVKTQLSRGRERFKNIYFNNQEGGGKNGRSVG